MIRNYLKTALRIMMRQKSYSAINISGLTLGIAASLLIILYVVDELSYDRFHKGVEQMHRIGFFGKLNGNDFVMATSPAPVAAAAMNAIPEVESITRFGVWRNIQMNYEEKSFTEKTMLVADSNFFEFFSFPLLKGNIKTALRGTNKIVITESSAKRYFGNEDPIGKLMLRGADKIACQITGVTPDPPSNSHIQFDFIISGESWDYMKSNEWTSNNLYTYLKINANSNIQTVSTKLIDIGEKNIGAELEKVIGLSIKQLRAKGDNVGLFTQPVTDIHLKSNLSEELNPNGNLQYVYIFMAVAVFIILIACINFMNLSTARSANRAKEVGVRKSIGAFRGRLITQFLSESMIYSFLSMVLAVMLIFVLIGPFNTLAGKRLELSTFASPLFFVSILLFALFVGLIAGSYPAFYLTAFKPVDVLKGKVRSGFKNSKLRNSLVVLQFVISISLMLGSIVVYKQLKFMQEKNIGFDKENVVDLFHTWSLGKNAKAFKNELAMHSEFKSSSFSSNLPPHITWSNAYRKGGTEQDFLLQSYQVDFDHLDAMKYQMVMGRFFSRDFPSDSTAIILNETAYKLMGFDNIENQQVLNYSGDKPWLMNIIGVMKDFNFETLRNEVKPMAILLGGEPNGEMAIRLSPGNTEAQIKLLESIWKKHSSSIFEYSFLDQNFDALFRAEQRMSSIILLFTILTIFIACLGLFGLATYVGEQRAKEISIRKVMGASMTQVAVLLFRDFTLLVVVAFCIAAPLGVYLMDKWLSGFAFHVGIDAWVVIIAGAASLFIALFTISFQSMKAARENPVKALKNE
ncbi:MAG: FtsX-like permease family protein [Chryseolinea sp.]